MIVCEVHKKMLIRWLIVCAMLLVSPYTLLLLIPFFAYNLFTKKYNRLDILLLYFLSYLIFNSLALLEGLANVRYLLIAIVVTDVLFKKNNKSIRDRTLISFLFIFLVYILFNIIFVSFIKEHSFFQYLQFVILILFTFISTNFNNISEFKYNFDNVYNLYIVILIMSVFSLMIPSISFGRNGIGFQGITLHPNAFGVFFSGFTALSFILYVYKNKMINLLFFLVSLTLLFFSQSRTSFLSVILGLAIYFLLTADFRKKISKSILLIVPTASLFLIVFYEKISTFLFSFLVKNNNNNTIISSIESSRGALIEAQIKNIEENTFFGIGFKVPSSKILQTIDESNIIKYEKGNLFLACIEELGIIGFILFITIIIFLIFHKNMYNKVFIILPLVLFITTFGESTLFSIGGLGTFIWTMMFLNRKNNYKPI